MKATNSVAVFVFISFITCNRCTALVLYSQELTVNFIYLKESRVINKFQNNTGNFVATKFCYILWVEVPP